MADNDSTGFSGLSLRSRIEGKFEAFIRSHEAAAGQPLEEFRSLLWSAYSEGFIDGYQEHQHKIHQQLRGNDAH